MSAAQAKGRGPEFYGRLLGTLFLSGLGGWFVLTQEANFRLGGRTGGTGSRRGTFIDATGFEAVVIGGFLIGLGIINLALGIRSNRRIPVFWAGAALSGGAILYWLSKAALDVFQFINDVRTSG